MKKRLLIAGVGTLALLGAGLSTVAANADTNATGTVPTASSAVAAAGDRPNIVFVLTDDLSWNLVKHMPAVAQLQSEGMTFSNFVVSDSLCCPSRSSIFTGEFPHDTRVFTNTSPDGGYGVFHNRGEEANTFATALNRRGYRTAFMGKYLNGYTPSCKAGAPPAVVPPGWDEWDVAGNAYKEYGYCLAENHKTVKYGHQPKDYLVDVMSRKGEAFVRQAAGADKPFLLELATFAPHAPARPAPRDEDAFPGLEAPTPKAFNKTPSKAPGWLASRTKLSAADKKEINRKFRHRAQAVQSVDRMISSMRQTLRDAGVANDTYFVFGSDNGFHMGEYRLMPGKQTAFDTDINVPLVVVGPRIRAGSTSNEITSNVDLAPTFQRLGGAPVEDRVDGHSLVGLLHGDAGQNWRNVTLVEHHGDNNDAADPDLQAAAAGNPPTYDAIRSKTYTYVEYANGQREFYDLQSDPQQLHNVAGTLSASRRAELHATLEALKNCHTGSACWQAGH
ncbi:sulfatase-like hydrolase/transferase [Actinoplanes sp. NPDC051475]|uniref:sulfatase-like hydrolase/transferase n=1 Tax=Actinoplanes sp. NPDC051475 TaxID=3157225 RepID=UPI00344BED7E